MESLRISVLVLVAFAVVAACKTGVSQEEFDAQAERIAELESVLAQVASTNATSTTTTEPPPAASVDASTVPGFQDPIAVVVSIVESVNGGDLAGIVRHLATDTTWAYGDWSSYHGRDEVVEWVWEPRVALRAEPWNELDPYELLSVHGADGDWLYFTVRNPHLEEVAVDEVAIRFEDGLIVEWHEGKCGPDSLPQFLAFWCEDISPE